MSADERSHDDITLDEEFHCRPADVTNYVIGHDVTEQRLEITHERRRSAEIVFSGCPDDDVFRPSIDYLLKEIAFGKVMGTTTEAVV